MLLPDYLPTITNVNFKVNEILMKLIEEITKEKIKISNTFVCD